MSGTMPGHCLNCGASLLGPYCAACGQKVTAPNPTFRDLMHEYMHELLHVDGRLFRSVRLLLARPGELTREYCNGRRARYLSPLRLYLIFSVLFFAAAFAAATVSPVPTRVQQDAQRGQVVHTGGIMISGEQLLAKLTPQQIEERVQRAERVWLPRLMLVLVPAWALLVMLVTRREKRHYPEHLWFALRYERLG